MVLGTIKPCLVVVWGSMLEGSAKWCEAFDKKFWLITVEMAKGKNGKEACFVTATRYAEDDCFILL